MVNELRYRRVPIESLHNDPANVRLHPDANMRAIADSLRSYGQVEPLVVQAGTGRVIGGNGRLDAMRNLGWSEVDIVEVDVDDVRAAAIGIALNRTSELASWDDGALAALLQSLPTDVPTGFSEGDLEALLAGLNPVEVVEDEPPEVEAVVAELNPVASGDTSEQLDGLVYKVLVECDAEQAQVELLERLEAEGYKCRALML